MERGQGGVEDCEGIKEIDKMVLEKEIQVKLSWTVVWSGGLLFDEDQRLRAEERTSLEIDKARGGAGSHGESSTERKIKIILQILNWSW